MLLLVATTSYEANKTDVRLLHLVETRRKTAKAPKCIPNAYYNFHPETCRKSAKVHNKSSISLREEHQIVHHEEHMIVNLSITVLTRSRDCFLSISLVFFT